MASYTTIPGDVTFDITVGGNTLISLQKLLLFLLGDKTEEEIQEAYNKIVQQQFDEEWIEHYAFLAYMIQYLERTAIDKGLGTTQTVDEPTTP